MRVLPKLGVLACGVSAALLSLRASVGGSLCVWGVHHSDSDMNTASNVVNLRSQLVSDMNDAEWAVDEAAALGWR